MSAPDRSAAYSREWDVARVAWQQVPNLLDEGWEPFAVVGRGVESEADLVYLRRRAKHTRKPVPLPEPRLPQEVIG